MLKGARQGGRVRFSRQVRAAQPRRLSDTSDGDTPIIDQPVRMVSVDTPEKAHYAGLPLTAQPKLDRCRQRLEDGTFAALPDGLRERLIARLTPDAAARHIGAGLQATAAFKTLQATRLTRPDGGTRRAAVIPTGEIIDRYGRLLAYLAPWFAGPPNDPLPPRDHRDRRTFNLDMVASGWGAMFLIYPSLPRNDDLNLLIDEAEAAWAQRRGAWAEFGEDLLLGYEYRACIKLAKPELADPAATLDEAFQRLCVDLRDLRLVGRFDYHQVPPSRRLWIWQDDLEQARLDLQLPRYTAEYVCTDYQTYGHHPRWPTRTLSGQEEASELNDEDAIERREAARVERRRVIEHNKAWRSAEVVRLDFLNSLLARRTPPKTTAAFVARALAHGHHEFARAAAEGHPLACQLFGVDPAPRYYGSTPEGLLSLLEGSATAAPRS